MAISHRGGPARRDVLRGAIASYGLGMIGANAGQALFSPLAYAGAPSATDRILVVVELSGANDGLNTVVPYADDAYYRARPRLGIPAAKLRKLDSHFGLQSTMAGFERLYKDGNLAIVQGVGYDNPSFSHFTSMAYWHTAAPNSGDSYGWLGRLADSLDPANDSNFLVDVQNHESLAVRAPRHVPLVFDDPQRFARDALFEEKAALTRLNDSRGNPSSPTQAFLFDVASSAQTAEQRVRDACTNYRTPVDYGLYKFGLERVAALIAAQFSTPIYYVAYPNNAFDTHVYQPDTHARLLTYVSDHVSAFLADMQRIGRGNDVAVMIFSEFGRRVAENANLGTDHGTAGPVFVAGKLVRGGQYGEMPSLSVLDDGNMRFTTDFRRVYATMIGEWMQHPDVGAVLHKDFATLGILQA
jgi:uncharacterized protein (DUF1501 family)